MYVTSRTGNDVRVADINTAIKRIFKTYLSGIRRCILRIHLLLIAFTEITTDEDIWLEHWDER